LVSAGRAEIYKPSCVRIFCFPASHLKSKFTESLRTLRLCGKIYNYKGKRVVTHGRIRYWMPVIIWMLVIFWMSTGAFSATNTSSFFEGVLRAVVPDITSARLAMLHAFLRKSGHLTEYFILGLLLFRTFRGGSLEHRTLRWALLSFAVLVLYASSDEFHQMFVPSRTASVADVCIDAAGGAIAQVVSVWRFRTVRARVSEDRSGERRPQP